MGMEGAGGSFVQWANSGASSERLVESYKKQLGSEAVEPEKLAQNVLKDIVENKDSLTTEGIRTVSRLLTEISETTQKSEMVAGKILRSEDEEEVLGDIIFERIQDHMDSNNVSLAVDEVRVALDCLPEKEQERLLDNLNDWYLQGAKEQVTKQFRLQVSPEEMNRFTKHVRSENFDKARMVIHEIIERQPSEVLDRTSSTITKAIFLHDVQDLVGPVLDTSVSSDNIATGLSETESVESLSGASIELSDAMREFETVYYDLVRNEEVINDPQLFMQLFDYVDSDNQQGFCQMMKDFTEGIPTQTPDALLARMPRVQELINRQ